MQERNAEIFTGERAMFGVKGRVATETQFKFKAKRVRFCLQVSALVCK